MVAIDIVTQKLTSKIIVIFGLKILIFSKSIHDVILNCTDSKITPIFLIYDAEFELARAKPN